jgi:hypothetical protein
MATITDKQNKIIELNKEKEGILEKLKQSIIIIGYK